jgi:hypothetical protein
MTHVPPSLAAIVGLACSLLACCCASAVPSEGSKNPVIQSITELTAIVKARDLSRDQVVDVKERFKPADPEYRHARQLYRQAFADFDAWTLVLAAGIQAGATRDLRSDKAYQDATEAAKRSAAEFSAYVESVIGTSKGVSALTSIVDLGLKLWVGWHQEAFKVRKEIADDLAQKAKWEVWEAIKAEKESPPPKSSPAHGADAPAGAPERWALIAGVGTYDDPYIQPLHGDADATAFATARTPTAVTRPASAAPVREVRQPGRQGGPASRTMITW